MQITVHSVYYSVKCLLYGNSWSWQMFLKRKNYEETMMVRLNMTREEKHRKRGLMGMSSQLNNIARFGDITALTGGEAQVRLWTGITGCSAYLLLVVVIILACIYVMYL